METGHVLCGLCVVVVLIYQPRASAEGTCAEFEFLAMTNNSNTYNVKHNSSLDFQFILSTKNCTELNETFTITVGKKSSENVFVDNCKLSIDLNGSCSMSFNDKCVCTNISGSYYLRMNDTNDETSWIWKTFPNNIAPEKHVQFKVKFPSTIYSLFLLSADNNTILMQNASLDISCTYDPGVPPKLAVITDWQGNQLNVTINKGGNWTARHYLPRVGCEDSGKTYTCQAPEAMVNKTATLLVKCPPDFTEQVVKQFVFDADQPAEFQFEVYSHTKHLSYCLLTRCPEPDAGVCEEEQNATTVNRNTIIVNCSSYTSLYGSPPKLTLSMKWRKVTPQDKGKWRLMIANEDGPAEVIFLLNISDPAIVSSAPAVPPSTSPKHSKGIVGLVIVAAIMCPLIAIVIISVIIFVMVRRFKRLYRSGTRQISRERVEVNYSTTRETVASVHDYDAIRRETAPDESKYAKRRQPPNSSREIEEVGNYSTTRQVVVCSVHDYDVCQKHEPESARKSEHDYQLPTEPTSQSLDYVEILHKATPDNHLQPVARSTK